MKKSNNESDNENPSGLGGGVLPEKMGGSVRPASQNLHSISDQNRRFSLPYLWPDRNSILYLSPESQINTLFSTWLIISYLVQTNVKRNLRRAFLMVFSIMMKKELFLKNSLTHLKTRRQRSHALFQCYQTAKFDGLFHDDQNQWKTIPRTYL